MTRAAFPKLAAGAERRLADLTDSVTDHIVRTIAVYRSDLVPVDELRRSIRDNLQFVVAALANPAAPRDLMAPKSTGSRRAAQGVPLPEVLQVYRLTFVSLWEALMELTARGRVRVNQDTLLEAATFLWQLSDEHASAVTEAYRATQADLLAGQERRRHALVEALLHGGVTPGSGPWEAAQLLELPPDSDHIVVVAQTLALAQESLRGIEKLLAAEGMRSAWRLAPALQMGVVSLGAVPLDVALRVLETTATARTGVSPTYRPLGDTPRALRLARAALQSIPVGEVAVRMFSANPLAALLAASPQEAERLANDVFAGLRALPAGDRAMLLETLDAYLDNDGVVARIGRVLHCHPNTVRHRLRRLAALTGRSLNDPIQLAELASAAYSLRVLPAVGPDAT